MSSRWDYNPSVVKSLYLNDLWSIQRIGTYFGVGYKAVRNALLRELVLLRKRNTDGLHSLSDDVREKIRQALTGDRNPNHRSKLSKTKMLWLREQLDRIRPQNHTPETIRKISDIRIERGLARGDRNPMSNPSTIQKWAKSNRFGPNKKEKRLLEILNAAFPGAYRLNVDGKMVVGTKIPDFIDPIQRKIVELWGDFWHKGEDPSGLVCYYKNLGYDALIVWEHELTDEVAVIGRLREFSERRAA